MLLEWRYYYYLSVDYYCLSVDYYYHYCGLLLPLLWTTTTTTTGVETGGEYILELWGRTRDWVTCANVFLPLPRTLLLQQQLLPHL